MKMSERVGEGARAVWRLVELAEQSARDSARQDNAAGERWSARANRLYHAYLRLRAAEVDWRHYEQTGEDCPKGRVW